VVSRDTRDQDFASNRQLFLTEQGYQYNILYDYEVENFHPAILAAQFTNPAYPALPEGPKS
jgi:hypothetical protein